VENIVAEADELVVGRVFGTIPANAEEWTRLRAGVRANDIFRKLLISEDERSTGIQVETYIPDDRSDLMYALNLKIQDLLEKIPGEETAHVAGFPIMAATFMNSMQRDNERFFPLVIALVVLTLLLTFRSFSGVALPMAVVVISIIWTFAIMVLFGFPLDMMTTTLPVFLIAIGVADGVHLVSDFRDQLGRHESRRNAVVATMRRMALPIIMTSITTAVGFVALSFTDVAPIRRFGMFVAVGVVSAMALSLTFIPAVMAIGRKLPQSAKPARGRLFARVDALAMDTLVAVSRFAARRNRWVLALGVLLVAGASYGLTLVRAENDFLTYFDEQMPVVQGSHALDAHMAGSNVINVLVHGPADVEQPFKHPAYLAEVEGLQRHLGKQAIVGKTTSLVDVLKRINLVMHGNDPGHNRLPAVVERGESGAESSGRELVAQYLLLYENGGGENLSDTVDTAFSTINISVILNTQNSLQIGRLIEDTQRFAEANFPAGMTITFAGGAEMAVTTNNEIVETQITSLTLSLGLILVLLMVQFRSAGKGLLAIVPLAFTVVLNFGFMGYLGITLNIAIAVMSSIVIGVGVDFAIHYLTRLQSEAEQGVTQVEAIANTMRASGKAITANAAIVGLAFLALGLSDLYPLQLMGLLITQTLLFSAVATLLLLPAAAAFFQPGFLRLPAPPAAPVLALEGEASGD
jgi:predicted RND superfamily exporter protein